MKNFLLVCNKAHTAQFFRIIYYTNNQWFIYKWIVFFINGFLFKNLCWKCSGLFWSGDIFVSTCQWTFFNIKTQIKEKALLHIEALHSVDILGRICFFKYLQLWCQKEHKIYPVVGEVWIWTKDFWNKKNI